MARVDRRDARLLLGRGRSADVRLEPRDRGVLAHVPERVRNLVRVRGSRLAHGRRIVRGSPPDSTRARHHRRHRNRRAASEDDHRSQPRRRPVERGERVLLVDLDPQANATWAGREGDGTSIYGLLEGAPVRGRVPIRTRTSTRARQPALAGAEVELAGDPDGARYLAGSLTGAATATTTSSSTATVLRAAHRERARRRRRVIVPVQSEYHALEGLSQLLGTIEDVTARLNPRLGIAGILLTMDDGRTRLAAEVEAEVRRHFGELVFTRPCRAGPPRRGAQPRLPCDRVRPPLLWGGGVLEGGDGACRARLDGVSAGSRGPDRRCRDRHHRGSPNCRSTRSTRTRGNCAAASSPRRLPASRA